MEYYRTAYSAVYCILPTTVAYLKKMVRETAHYIKRKIHGLKMNCADYLHALSAIALAPNLVINNIFADGNLHRTIRVPSCEGCSRVPQLRVILLGL